METNIFGYYIGSDVHFDIQKKLVVNVNQRTNKKIQVILRDTMYRLFVYLLEHADGTIIDNSDILLQVWDKYGLSSSNQRLWQVMQALKFKLNLVGVPSDFIMRVESKGYYVKESMLTVLYCEKKSSSITQESLDHYHDLHNF